MVTRGNEQDIWIWDVVHGSRARLTDGRRRYNNPVWTPDGHRLIFAAASASDSTIWWQSADGTGTAERLTDMSGTGQLPTSITPDGAKLLFYEPNTNSMSVLTLGRDPRVTSLLRKPGVVFINGEVSPSGRWIAYESSESGDYQVFVRPFPDIESGRWLVSSGGGRMPSWSRDGRELFYVAPDAC